MMTTKFVWKILYYHKKLKKKVQIIYTAHANVTAVTNNQ